MITDADLDRAVEICCKNHPTSPDELWLMRHIPQIAAEVRRLRTIPDGECWKAIVDAAYLRNDWEAPHLINRITADYNAAKREIERLKAENEALRKEHEAAPTAQAVLDGKGPK